MERFRHVGKMDHVMIEDSETNDTLVGLEVLDKMNELHEENKKLKSNRGYGGWMDENYNIRLLRLEKENNKLKQLIVRSAKRNESAEKILDIAKHLELIKNPSGEF